MCIVLGGYLRIFGAPSIQSCCTLSISDFLTCIYLSVADIPNPDFIVSCCRTRISLDMARFYEEQFQPSSWSALADLPQKR